MFASSQYPMPGASRRNADRSAPLHGREGRESEASRQASVALLLPNGQPSAWLLLLAGSCVYVLVQAFALHAA